MGLNILKKINIHDLYEVFLNYFRKKRMHLFIETFSPNTNTWILDIGGTQYNWNVINCQSQILLLNLSVPNNPNPLKNISFVQGDGKNLKYDDKKFNICFSNSVIEHVGTFENQKLFAKELSRVGENVWVQTPAKWFFIEPHLLTPFIHYLPKKIQKPLLRNFTIWGLITRPSSNQVENFLSETRLLNYCEMKELFPDCEILREKFLGFTKSFIAVKNSRD